MFTITLEDRQYKTYILTDQSVDSQVEIVPERGGIITLWRIQGREIFYLDKERFTDPKLSVRGGNPILFPICGNLPENTYTHQGKQYTLKQHGFARELPWEVTEQSTQDKASLTVVLNSSDQTRSIYPFDFQVTFTYQLQGHTLEILQEYKNLSSEPMPFSAGFHPYFLATDKTQLEFEIPSGEYLDWKTKETYPFNGYFDLNQEEIDVAFRRLSQQSASVTDKAQKLKLTLEFDDFFSTLVFWTVKGKEFYCLEPWSAPRNAINTGEQLTVLEPGSTRTTTVKLSADFS